MEPLILTYTGLRVNPLRVEPTDIRELDVAHALSCLNRFNGTTERPISIAQHAVFVSRLLDGTGLEWQGLHHDDAEAYLGDVTKWLKSSPEMAAFRAAEDYAQRSCYEFFGVEPSHYETYPDLMHPIVRAADRLMVRYEGGQSFPKGVWDDWCRDVVGLDRYGLIGPEERAAVGPWRPWSWRQAKEAWLLRARLLRDDGLSEPTTLRNPTGVLARLVEVS